MFCPKCSQLQATEEMRYCSRCGFSLESVSLILRHDGSLPQSEPPTDRCLRSRIATESFILTAFSWAIALTCTFWFNASGIYEGIATIGALTFFVVGFVGLLRFLYAFLFLKPTLGSATQPGKLTGQSRPQLPHAQTSPISDYPRPKTREVVPQPSVTENTTRILNDV